MLNKFHNTHFQLWLIVVVGKVFQQLKSMVKVQGRWWNNFVTPAFDFFWWELCNKKGHKVGCVWNTILPEYFSWTLSSKVILDWASGATAAQGVEVRDRLGGKNAGKNSSGSICLGGAIQCYLRHQHPRQ